jgi:hypothetical protein
MGGVWATCSAWIDGTASATSSDVAMSRQECTKGQRFIVDLH